MLQNYTLTQGFWKKISTAGQTGTAWLKSANGFNAKILISHTATPQNPDDDILVGEEIDLDIDAAYLLPCKGISNFLTADSENDIFYATLRNPGKTCIITADFAAL